VLASVLIFSPVALGLVHLSGLPLVVVRGQLGGSIHVLNKVLRSYRCFRACSETTGFAARIGARQKAYRMRRKERAAFVLSEDDAVPDEGSDMLITPRPVLSVLAKGY
jgi:hypothetical protein